MKMATIMSKLRDIFDEFGFYPANINCDNQFDVPQFTDFFTKKGTNLWFSQPEQPHKNAIIERFWRTLALLIQRMREGIKNFDWVKALPDTLENYNDTYHRSVKAKPIYVLEGKKENPIERKIVESVLKKGMRVRIKTKKSLFAKGDIHTFSRDIYQIIEKKRQTTTLKNLTTGKDIKRTYIDEELDQTFDQPEVKETKAKKKHVVKPKLNPKEVIAQRKEKRKIKAPVRLNL